jgi:hypothetical protein
MTHDLNPIRANIYPPAWDAVSPAESFPWHKYSHLPHSSQALAVDVFGTLKMLDSDRRDAILADFASSISVPSGGPWSVDLEWLDPKNRLREPRQTQVDVLLKGAQSTICVECKFTENAGGSCSQTTPINQGLHKGKVQCDSRYAHQVNPINGKKAKCALTGKGIRYWDFIPDVFKYSAELDYNPCPFAGAEFQWMRNMVLASAVATDERTQAAFVLMYADSPSFQISQYVKGQDWRAFTSTIRTEAICVQAASYQSFIAAEESLNSRGIPSPEWQGLCNWVSEKISRKSG